MLDRNPVITSSRRLPSGRAVVGGLLVTLAVLAVLIAARLGEDSAFQDVVVARADLAPGTVLGPEELASVRIRLDETATFAISDATELYGSVLLGPVARLELIQRSNVAAAPAGDIGRGLAVVSVAVEPERAPPSLAAGELVSIFGSFSGGEGSRTELIADRVVVLSYLTDGSDFSNEAVLRVGLADGDVAAAIVDAAQTGELTIVGVTGAPDVDLPELVTR